MPRTSHHRRPLGGGRGSRRNAGGRASAPAWSPASLTNLRGWYRADLGLTLVGGDVDAWADQSGNGNHLTAAAAGNRPLYAATGFAGSSHPYVEGDGAAEWLRRAAFSWGGAVGAFTVTLIAHVQTPVNNRALWQYGAGVPPFAQITALGVPFLTGIGSVVSTGLSALTTARVSSYRWDGANQQVYAGAAQEDSDANAGAAPADGGTFSLFAGATGLVPTNMRIAEAIVQRAAMTADERTALVAYVARYGL